MPEFPAAVAAAFLIMAAICSFAPFEDRYILAGFLAAIGLIAAIAAILTCRQAQTGNSSSATPH